MRFLALVSSILVALPFASCDQSSVPSSPTQPAEDSDSITRASEAARSVAERLRSFHQSDSSTCQAGSGQACDLPEYRRNWEATDPGDSIRLLPSDLLEPLPGMFWWYDEEGMTTQSSTFPARVPLRGGIRIWVWGPYGPDGLQHASRPVAHAPILSRGSGPIEYLGDSLSMHSPQVDAVIHYTLDGSYPTLSSAIMKTKLSLDGALAVRSISVLPDGSQSLSVRASFTPAGGWKSDIPYDTLLDLRDGQRYPIVKLGTQTWMAQNLNCLPAKEGSRDPFQGVQYSHIAIRDASITAICPEGWRLPKVSDWTALIAWAKTREGVVSQNVGNALRSTALTSATGINAPFASDVFGFRATSTRFWTDSVDIGTHTLIELSDSARFVRIMPDSSGFLSPSNFSAPMRCLRSHD